MSKPHYPRPGFTSAPAKERVEVVNPDDIRAAYLAAGIDPDTIPADSKNTITNENDLANLIEAEVVRDCLADDLNKSEALAFAAAFWVGAHRKNADRAKSVWRIITFMTRHPHCGWNDIPPDLLDTSFFNGYAMPRKTVSSLIHHWFATGAFARAEKQLNALALARWSEHRRQQLATAVAWERDVQARTTAKRKARLLKNVKRDTRVRVRKESKS